MNDDRPLLVFFWSERSGPARRMESLLAHLERKERDRLRVRRVDVDASPELAERFQVDVVPTLVLVKDKRAVSRLDGRTSAPKIEAMLEPHLARARRRLKPPAPRPRRSGWRVCRPVSLRPGEVRMSKGRTQGHRSRRRDRPARRGLVRDRRKRDEQLQGRPDARVRRESGRLDHRRAARSRRSSRPTRARCTTCSATRDSRGTCSKRTCTSATAVNGGISFFLCTNLNAPPTMTVRSRAPSRATSRPRT